MYYVQSEGKKAINLFTFCNPQPQQIIVNLVSDVTLFVSDFYNDSLPLQSEKRRGGVGCGKTKNL